MDTQTLGVPPVRRGHSVVRRVWWGCARSLNKPTPLLRPTGLLARSSLTAVRALNGYYMPRRDWNTNAAHSQKPRHKKMHSGAHGRGLDRKLKEAKRGEAPPRSRYDKRTREEQAG